MDLDYAVREGVPSVDEYRHLRGATGLGAKSVEASALGLPNTWFGVVVEHGGETVGMGRIIGDGGCFFQVVDICVLPEHQGRGLGKRIMAALTAAMETRMPEGAYVSLIADGEARRLYARYGFAEVMPASVGMARLFT
ncbi:GNAT family N-acetyltransferase [Phytomonospora endophytica]|uniref:Ribosomal protein S18 acetylase RimI-like enzyme n=1 Tax=Phytomonospora endophytica TaxID=714109 RepID=A0A841FQ40_9ACTN|nr:GNAT family N-acetyltransferase [Phytomonospora endophytica]MBB6034070.1 ribosomal protein S18 acetylase RimI-like enzyme [Phytomonospora endophytica]GIG66464.1 AttT protein [Phytomonospora endophytica]